MKTISNLIILDWDDTLFPTSWFGKEKSEKKKENVLKGLEKKLIILFRRLKRQGDVAIVTNATMGWLDMCLSRMPQLEKDLSEVTKISARDEMSAHISSPYLWKLSVFRKLQKRKAYESIVSVGDASYEYRALVGLFTNTGNSIFLKAIRLLGKPTIRTLVNQIETLTAAMGKISSAKKHIDMRFEVLKNE